MTSKAPLPTVAIVDYGLGNLFSVEQACRAVGLNVGVSSDARALAEADALILPGVGAFADAMDTLRRLDLISVLIDTAASGRPVIGICLGVQLLMTESCEFGSHKGLGLIPGQVVPIKGLREDGRPLKVPHVGWNGLRSHGGTAAQRWAGTPLQALAEDDFVYFVHSYVVVPENDDVILSTTRYGDFEFCSSVRRDNVFACQFHPERSGRRGLQVYAAVRQLLEATAPSQRRSE